MFSYYKRIFDLELLKCQKVFFYGLSALALSAITYLRNEGIYVLGLCDNTISADGEMLGDIQLLSLSALSSAVDKKSIVIYASTNQCHANEIQKYIQNSSPDCKFLMLENISEVYIDVSGKCNLRCRSCQVCNHAPESFDYNNRSEMSITLFRKILQKVKVELPDNPVIFLFNYGEPLLSKNLPMFVETVHAHGMTAVISSNLSLEYDFESLLKTKPDVFKISVSGFTQKVYGSTHNGGNIELVKKNMQKIHDLIAQYKLYSIRVIVGYHIYKNNYGEEYIKMKKLCKKLGFLFQPRRASFCNIPKQSGIDDYSESDCEFIQAYYENSEDILNTAPLSRTQTGICNVAKNKLFIDYNGDVMLCYLVMHKEAIFHPYLEVPLTNIRNWQQAHWICNYCKQVGLASLA